MKNLSIVLNVILLIAVAVLYVLHFSNSNTESTSSTNETEVINLKDLSIAYVNTDSILKNYTFFEELSSQFEEQQKKAEANLQRRAQGLQQEVVNFQNTAGNMTRNQAMAVQEDLQKKEQNLMQYEQKLRQDLMLEEAKMTDSIYTKLTGFLKEYGKENDLKLVLTYQRGSGVLFANDGLNITDIVIDGLNEAHSKKQTQPSDSTGTK